MKLFKVAARDKLGPSAITLMAENAESAKTEAREWVSHHYNLAVEILSVEEVPLCDQDGTEI